MLEHVGPRTACSFGTWHKDPNEHAVFGSCRGYVGFLLVRTGGSYLHLLFGLYFANLGFKKTGHDSITKLPGLGPSQTWYVVLFRVTDKSAPQFR